MGFWATVGTILLVIFIIGMLFGSDDEYPYV